MLWLMPQNKLDGNVLVIGTNARSLLNLDVSGAPKSKEPLLPPLPIVRGMETPTRAAAALCCETRF